MMTENKFDKIMITQAEAEKLVREFYEIKADAKPLPGEVDFNLRLTDKDNHTYLLKISSADADEKQIDFQIDMMHHLNNQNLPFEIPKPIASKPGRFREIITNNQGRVHHIRLQSWLEGRMLGDVNPRSSDLLRQWGGTCGWLCKVLKEYDHPAAHRSYKWNPAEMPASKEFLKFITDKELQETAYYFVDLFEKTTTPLLPKLRQSVNYNDAHEHNLLVNSDFKNPKIIGLIDFGDAIYTQTISELAIACTYACMDKRDPLEAAREVIKGFHSIFPLEEKEVEVLFSLITARLLITIATAAHNKHIEPENAYLQISDQSAIALLKKLWHIPPTFAHYTFRAACGWNPCPKADAFKQWAIENKTDFAPVIRFDNKIVKPVDLSIGSLELGNNANFKDEATFERTLHRLLEDKAADIGMGGYGEVRPFYTTDAYQTRGNEGMQWRTVHLGLDIWTPAETPVCAPYHAIVHSFADNKDYRDYGATIILEHKTGDDLKFYTLYGHLSKSSLTDISEGMTIRKGEQFAAIGNHNDNGGWPPHLHFQVMLDMLGKRGDFPGVAYAHEKEIWLSLCPDPQLLIAEKLPGNDCDKISQLDILKKRQQHLGKSLSVSYDQPLHIRRGYMQYLYDATARRYLDTVNNVAHVGHEHPAVAEAACRQNAVLNTNTRYLHSNIIQLAEELLQTFPKPFSVVYFVNSGSEANELALRIAKTLTHQKDIIAIETGYHGNTGACIDVSSYKFDGKGGQGAPDHTHILPMPDVFRGIIRESETAGKDYAQYVHKLLEQIHTKGRDVAGFIGESILSCGGQIVLPQGYLAEIYAAVRSNGGLCIADEVQTGFGRVGHSFWAFEQQQVIPDIVTVGKPFGNGHPLAAVVTTQTIADAFANGMEYFNTFGGNPVSCAIGSAVLKVIKNEHLQQNALGTGNHLIDNLKTLQSRFPIIGNVRGAGLFLGFELIENSATLKPATDQAAYLANRMRQRGILMSVDGPDNNVLKIKPPICFSQKDADFLLEHLDVVLREDFMRV
ncbi:MAG TPA: aminotransferase class III-fold pyridoxal phosphate-dependent enzyme [Bacteroidales bacterium]|nr:aminotransferase class III-fold pyridoxal phosphate-dependent enzyme [Bacteroidales bacterium]